MRRTFLIVVAVAAVAAIEAIAFAPAVLVDARLSQASGGILRLTDAEGTLWHARATLVAGTAHVPIAWRIAPWALLTGELRVQLLADERLPAAPLRAELAVRDGQFKLRDADLTLPASFVLAAAPKVLAAAGWVASGELRLTATSIDWAPPASRGDARLEWHGAGLGFPGSAAPLSLGDVAVALTARDDTLSGTLSNQGGDLRISGSATLRSADGVRLSLLLTPERGDSDGLTRILSAIGTRDGNGWRVEWRVPLR